MERDESERNGSMLEEVSWKNGRGSSGQVQGEGQQKRSFQRQKRSFGMEAGAQKQEKQNKKVERRLLGQNLRFVQRIQLATAAKQAGKVGEEEEEMKQQQRMKIMKDLTKKISSKERMESGNRWWVF